MLDPCLHTALAVRPIVPAPDPVAAFERLRADGSGWLLESALRGGPLGRHSFAGAAPYAVARVRGRALELEVRRGVDPRFAPGRHRLSGDPLELLRSVLPPPAATAPPLPFGGGAVGYLGYELAEETGAPRLHARDDLRLPDAELLLVDRVLAFDHESGRVFATGLGLADDPAHARARAARAADDLADALAAPRRAPTARALAPCPHAEQAIDASAYAKAVDAVKQEIAAGNVYQACLTSRACRRFGGDPWRLYLALRRLNPAPFACYLELEELAVVGSSPERFLRVGRNGLLESRPIKGTAARGRDPLEDAERRRALARSEKDRAENLMIVDLVRNDLGRVCETGSVRVSELMSIEAYSSVFQMVSTVEGRLVRGRDVFDAVRAAFPPGSMTGAPKIAAMALLGRLEPVRRAVYSGAVGYFDVGGAADLSVVIRSALVKDGCAWLHAGGGVVADSDPAGEYREALDKLRPLLAALEEAGAPVADYPGGRTRRKETAWDPSKASGSSSSPASDPDPSPP